MMFSEGSSSTYNSTEKTDNRSLKVLERYLINSINARNHSTKSLKTSWTLSLTTREFSTYLVLSISISTITGSSTRRRISL